MKKREQSIKGRQHSRPVSKDTKKIIKNPVLKVILQGVYDEGSPLSKLRGCQHLLRTIWEDVIKFWSDAVELPGPIKNVDESTEIPYYVYENAEKGNTVFLAPIANVNQQYYKFPKPNKNKLININMMPFIVGETWEQCKLPKFLKSYSDLIEQCIGHHSDREHHHIWMHNKVTQKSDLGKVYYLTIQESEVEPGMSQRRPGLHVDSPGVVKIKNQEALHDEKMSEGIGSAHKYRGHAWGTGSCHMFSKNEQDPDSYLDFFSTKVYVTHGGIYIASNVDDSCRAWNCSIAPEAVGQLGNIEHLRHVLPTKSNLLKANQIYWMTDRTPHESLPLKKRTLRQFFRIVTSEVSFWYRDHSTPNPLGVVPDPSVTKIVVGDKFAEEGVEIVMDSLEKGMAQMKVEMKHLKLRNAEQCNYHKYTSGLCDEKCSFK